MFLRPSEKCSEFQTPSASLATFASFATTRRGVVTLRIQAKVRRTHTVTHTYTHTHARAPSDERARQGTNFRRWVLIRTHDTLHKEAAPNLKYAHAEVPPLRNADLKACCELRRLLLPLYPFKQKSQRTIVYKEASLTFPLK